MAKRKKGYPYYDMQQLTQNREPVFINISVDDEGEMEHNHGFYEVMAILSGGGMHWINGTPYNVMPGDVFLLNFGDKHYLNPNANGEKFRWITLAWIPSFYTLEDPVLLNNKKYNDRASMHITNLLLDSLYEYNLKQPDYIEIIKYQLMVILKKLRRLPNPPQTEYAEKHKKNLINHTIGYIQNHYPEPIVLKDIATALGISQAYLCKLFSDEVGMGVIQYLRKIRIEKAAQLLLTTEKTVSEIAFEVGYKDIKGFFAAFKAQKGVTPNNFRKHKTQ